jgi:hypothetical protein
MQPNGCTCKRNFAFSECERNLEEFLPGSPEFAGCGKAQRVVWTASNNISVMIVLSVVMPFADATDIVSAAFRKGAARQHEQA